MAENNTIGSASVELDVKMNRKQAEDELKKLIKIAEAAKKDFENAMKLGVYVKTDNIVDLQERMFEARDAVANLGKGFTLLERMTPDKGLRKTSEALRVLNDQMNALHTKNSKIPVTGAELKQVPTPSMDAEIQRQLGAKAKVAQEVVKIDVETTEKQIENLDKIAQKEEEIQKKIVNSRRRHSLRAERDPAIIERNAQRDAIIAKEEQKERDAAQRKIDANKSTEETISSDIQFYRDANSRLQARQQEKDSAEQIIAKRKQGVELRKENEAQRRAEVEELSKSASVAGVRVKPNVKASGLSNAFIEIAEKTEAASQKIASAVVSGEKIEMSSINNLVKAYDSLIAIKNNLKKVNPKNKGAVQDSNDLAAALELATEATDKLMVAQKQLKPRQKFVADAYKPDEKAAAEALKIEKERTKEVEKQTKLRLKAESDALSLGTKSVIGDFKQTQLLPENTYSETKKKIESIKQSILDLTNQRNAINIDPKDVIRLDLEITKAGQSLTKLTSSNKSMKMSSLLGTMPQQLEQFKPLIAEIERRMGTLNIKTKEGAAAYAQCEKRAKELTIAHAQLSGSSKGVATGFEYTERAARNNSKAMSGMISMAKNYFSLFAVVRVVKNIQAITAEFEMQRIALGAIIQDQHKANQLFQQAQDMAVKSPFQVKDIITQMKQLSAYQIDKNILAETTSKLGDLSAGLGVPMERLILAYGQVNAASVLRGQELRQFTEAGIPLVQKLADKFQALNGVATTTGDVFQLISERKVPFEMVKDVLFEMTEEGGNFNKMQEKMSKTLKGSLSNLVDEIQITYNKVGEANMGLMKGTVDSAKGLMHLISKNTDLLSGVLYAAIMAKAATMAYNKIIGVGNIELSKTVALEAKRVAQAERFLVLSSGGSFRNAMSVKSVGDKMNITQTQTARKGMTSDDASKLLFMNKLDAQSIAYLHTQELLTVQQLKFHASLQYTSISANQAGAKLNMLRLGLNNLSVSFKRVSLFAKVAFAEIVIGLKAVALAFITNPMFWITAVVGGLISLVSSANSAKKAATEFATAVRDDVADALYRMQNGASKVTDVLKDLRVEMEGIIANKDFKVDIDSGKFDDKFKKLNNSSLALAKDNEALYSITLQRIANLDKEKDKYLEIQKVAKEYDLSLKKIASDPTKFSNMIDKSGLVEANEELRVIALTYKRQIEKNKANGSLALVKEIEALMAKGQNAKAVNLVAASKQIPTRSDDVKEAIAFEKKYENFIAKIKTEWKTTTTQGKSDSEVMINSLIKNGNDAHKNFLTLFKDPIYLELGIKPMQEAEYKGNTLINAVNKTIKDAKIDYNFPNTETEQNYGIRELEKTVIDQYTDVEEKLKKSQKSLATAIFNGNVDIVNALTKDVSTATITKKQLEDVINLLGLTKPKPKGGGAKAKTAFEIAYDKISTQKEVVDKMKALYEELAQSMSKIEAQQQVLDLFADSGLFGEGKLVSFKDIPSLSDGDVQIYLKNAIKQLEAIPKKLEADLKKINDYKIAVIKFDTEKLKEDTEKYIKAAEKELTNVRDRMDIFKKILDKSGDYGQAQTIAFSIEGKGGMDVGEMLVQQIKEALIREKTYTAEQLEGIIDPQAIIDLAQVGMSKKSIEYVERMVKEYKDHNKNLILDAITSADKLQSIEQQKLALVEQTAEKLRQLRKIPKSVDRDVAIDSATQAYEKKLAELELEQLKASETYIKAFSDLKLASQSTLVDLKSALVRLQKEQGKYLSGTDMKAIANQIKDIDDLMIKPKYSWKDRFIVDKETIANNQKIVNDLRLEAAELDAKIKANAATIIQGGAVGDLAGEGAWKGIKFSMDDAPARAESITQTKELEAVKKKLAEAEERLRIALEKQKKAANEWNEQAKVMQEYLGNIGSILSDTTTLVNGLSKAFGAKENEEFNKVMEELSSALAIAQAGMAIFALVTTTTEVVVGGATKSVWALNTAMYANPAFWIAAGLLAVVGALKLFIYFSDKAANTEIDNMEERIKASKKALASLENSIKDTAGNDYISNISQQIQELEDQAVSTQRQLEAERSKTKQDDDKIEEYENSVTSAQQAVIDKQRELISELAGGDLKSVTENMVKVFVDAHRAGADTFDAIKKSFGEMIDSMIVKTIAAQIIQTHLKGVLDMIETMVVGGITEGELAELSMGVLEASRNINSSMQAITPLLNATDNLFGGGIGGGSLDSGIAGASEETVSILAGYWLAHLDVTTFMRNDVAQILSIMQANNLPNAVSIGEDGLPNSTQLSDYSQMYLQNLVQIEANTALGARKTSEMLDMFNSMKVINDDGGSLFALKVR